jgi:signal transduction histidine kinase
MDAGRVEQILNNLLSNGLRYTPPGGTLTLRLAVSHEQAKIMMSDTGPGIPPEALPQLFERFYRVDRARSRQQGGTGLGLAIARQLALAHGGDLSAANRPEGGAVFTLSLPLASQRRPNGH